MGQCNQQLPDRMMIRILSVCLLVGLSAVRCEDSEEGEERLGYYSITSAGASTLSFNATSVQNMVILGLLLLVLGALILPMFGINILAEETNGASAYGSDDYGQVYANFAKRTGLDIMNPVLTALKKGRKKYGKKN